MSLEYSQNAHGGGGGGGGGANGSKEQEKDKRARMFDQHMLTGGEHCGKVHVVKTKPESEDDHIGEDLLADVIAHKHHHPRHHHHIHHHHGETKKPVVHQHVQAA